MSTKLPSYNFKLAQKRSAKNRQCPQCHRKSAMIKTEFPPETGLLYIKKCRWCGFEKCKLVP